MDVSRVLKEHTYIGDGLFVHLGVFTKLFQSLQQDLLPRCFRPSVCLWKNIYIISCDGVLAVLKEKTLQERTQNKQEKHQRTSWRVVRKRGKVVVQEGQSTAAPKTTAERVAEAHKKS